MTWEWLPLVVVAWCGHTAESAADAEDVEAALNDCKLLQKQAAIDMGLSPEKFSKQLAGVEPLNHWRLCFLPSSFQIAYAKRRLQRFGGVVFTQSERELLHEAVIAGRKTMARIVPDLFSEREKVS